MSEGDVTALLTALSRRVVEISAIDREAVERMKADQEG